MMMRIFPDHDDEFAHSSSEIHDASADYVEPFHVHQNAPDPHYYHNAPRRDEDHINTSSYECSTASSASYHSLDPSPKSNAAVATTVVHANDKDFSSHAPWHEERDGPEEVDDYRDDGYYNEPDVPHHGQESGWSGDYPIHFHPPPPQHGEFHPDGNGGPPNGFAPIPFDAPPHGLCHQVNHYPNHHQIHQQTSFSHPEYESNYQRRGPAQYAPQYHHEHHPNDPGYYTSAFDTALPEHYHHSLPPNGEASRADDQQNRVHISKGTAPVQVVGEYNERDILCGRGALMIWHPGNQFFRQLVQTHRQRYFFSRRQEKKKIASQIMEEVRNHGGRFLRRSQSSDGLNQINVWVEIDDERAYQKTCQALREGAPEIRRQWRNKPSRGANTKIEEAKENGSDNAASKRDF